MFFMEKLFIILWDKELHEPFDPAYSYMAMHTYLRTLFNTLIMANAEVKYHSVHYREKMHINKLDDDDNMLPVSLSPDIDIRSQVS